MPEKNLEFRYAEAQSALKMHENDRAAELLKLILQVDESYKDTSRLPARIDHEKRRRRYNNIRLWGAVIGVTVVGLMACGISRLSLPTFPAPASAPTPSMTAKPNLTEAAIPTIMPSPGPTAIPLMWRRISHGGDFERDTVIAFATDENDPNVIYAGMKNTGVYKTTDGGLSWHPMPNGLANMQVVSLLIDLHDPRILYAGTMGGIFKTEDGGENWFRIGRGNYLLMDIQDNFHLYARDENGIYETTDQGKSWSTVYPSNGKCPGTIRSWAIHPTDSKILFVGSEGECGGGIYRSDDGGHTWAFVKIKDAQDILALAVGLGDQGNYSVYVQSQWYGDVSGVFISFDGGQNWNKSEGSISCHIFATDAADPSTVFCIGSRLYTIRGHGNSWKGIPGTYSTRYTAIHIDHINDVDRMIVGGIDQPGTDHPHASIFISTNGGTTWVERSDGLGSTRGELKIDPSDASRIYLASSILDAESGSGNIFWSSCAIYVSQDRGRHWSSIFIEDRIASCDPAIDNDNVLYMTSVKSWNSGNGWIWTNGNRDTWVQYYLPIEVQSVSANPYVKGLLYIVGDTIYYSKNAGYTWIPSDGSKGLWDGRLFYKDLGRTLYAIGRYHQAYSSDSGRTWKNCGTDITTSSSNTRLVIDSQSSRLYLATPDKGVLISSDNCQSWQASNDGLTNFSINTLAIDPNNLNIIFAGTDGGVYISLDAGMTWGVINDGLLDATVVYSIAVDKDSNVYAATPYGIFILENK
jgi:photosystem II stability/assembly factor-like uncharacterized protein